MFSKKMFFILMAWLVLAGLTACNQDEGSSASSEDASVESNRLTVAFTQYEYSQTGQASVGFMESLINRVAYSLAADSTMHLTPKDADGETIPCHAQQANCSDGVRTYAASDLTADSFTLMTAGFFAEFIHIAIYDAQGVKTYESDGDIQLNNDQSALLIRNFNLYPNHTVSLSAGTLEKEIDFAVTLSDVTNEMFGYAASDRIFGELNCAHRADEGDYTLPQIALTHDSQAQTLTSADHSIQDLYVQSPCRLRIWGEKADGDVVIEGLQTFEVDEEAVQTIDTFHFDVAGQTLLGVFIDEHDSGKVDVTMDYLELDTSIRDFLNRSVDLTYRLNLKNDTLDETTELTLNQTTGLLEGNLPYAFGEEVTLTLQILKDNDSEVWLSSSQNATFDIGESTLPPFTVHYQKTVVSDTARTKGYVTLRLRDTDSGEIVPDAVVAFNSDSVAEEITLVSDENGLVIRTGLGNGLIYGVYTVIITHADYKEKTITFDLAESGVINRIVDLEFNTVFPGTALLDDAQTARLDEWLGDINEFWQLCYRRSTHGASSAEFHSRCDGQGPSMTIARLDNGRLIGGYASHSWHSNGGWFGDSTSFLFSLTTNHQHSHYRNNNYLLGHPTYGPTFGGGYDWLISSDMTTGAANLGHDYACRVGSYNTSECYNDFSGSYDSWSITEMEVFVRQ